MTAPAAAPVLLVKTTSLGDVVHALPALTDAARARPGLRFDWVVEEPFAPIARLHPAVDRVIPVALRRWRQAPLRALFGAQWREFRARLRERRYACVIDAQGLIKSRVLCAFATGPLAGFDRESAREPLAAHRLDHPVRVDRRQHAVTRIRQLVAAALGYDCPAGPADYGIGRAAPTTTPGPLWLLHGTTWPNKHWPEAHWRELAVRLQRDGRVFVLPHGSSSEEARARRIADGLSCARVLPRSGLAALVEALRGAGAFIGVDSGLAHLATALGVPGVALYGPTDPDLTGCHGGHAVNRRSALPCAPCRQRVCTFDGTAPVFTRNGVIFVLEPACLGEVDSAAALAMLADAERRIATRAAPEPGAAS